MAFTIGLFSLKSDVGVTATSIHIANFIAGSDKSVALVEYKDTVDPEFGKANTQFDEDGTFVLNNVRYYPAECKRKPSEDIVIIDFGVVNILFEFPNDIDKLYLCSDAGDEAFSEVEEFLSGERINPDILVFSLSKVDLREFLNANYKAILVGDKEEPRIDYNLAMAISSVLRKGRINPPDYHRDWEYDKVEFNYVTDPEKPEKKKLFGRKKKGRSSAIDVKKPDSLDNESIETVEEVEIAIATLSTATESNTLCDYDFSDIPLPSNGIHITEDESNDDVYIADVKIEDKNEDVPVPKSDEPSKRELRKQEKAARKEEKLRIANEKHQAKIDAKNAKKEARESKIRAAKEEKQRADFERKQQKLEESRRKKMIRSTKGILGRLIERADKEFDNVANIFIVTKMNRIFVFNDVNSFFAKLEILLRELRDSSNVDYIVITYASDEIEPDIISEKSDEELGDKYWFLESLDTDLRRADFAESDFSNHKELQLFDEIIYA